VWLTLLCRAYVAHFDIDAHAHVLEYGFKMQLQLDGSKSIDGQYCR
jgi:hypothetical protein